MHVHDDFGQLLVVVVWFAGASPPAPAFRRYEDASLSYTGIESHPGPSRYGLYDTVVAVDEVVRT